MEFTKPGISSLYKNRHTLLRNWADRFIIMQRLPEIMAQETGMACPSCGSAKTVKAGMKKLKREIAQRYRCTVCQKYFSSRKLKGKSYSPEIILNAVSLYNVGHTLEGAKALISKRFKTAIPLTTIHSWIEGCRHICTFSRLRKQACKLYTPNSIIHTQTLKHVQPYAFKFHKAKLKILLEENPQFSPLKTYLEKISSGNFPHHIFTYNKTKDNANVQRASQIQFEHLNIKITKKSNQENQLATLALHLATTNKQRHQAIQDFMLINDSSTIAIEVPVYLTNWDAGYYRNQRGFKFPLQNYTTPITGHIDLLQIRNGIIHILDYKPEAIKQKPVEQLTVYALALSRKLNLPLFHFKCAWFDENDYFEFFPLHAVYKRKV